jgi:membrane associated rhomboid family serine protease
MGIYDRDYVRREGPSFLGSIFERGTVCMWLIGINVVAFAIQMATRSVSPDGTVDQPFTHGLDLDVQAVVFSGQLWRLLTHAFLHDGIYHILFNMLFLWFFGRDVEDLYGPREFLAIYLVGALVSAFAFVGTSLPALLSYGINSAALGASGAVTAVLVIFAFHYPTRIIYVMFFIPVPIWLFVLVSVFMDGVGLLQQFGDKYASMHAGVAVAGHLGGAAFGFLYYKMHWHLSSFWPQFTNWKKRRSQPKLRVYREEDPPTPVSVTAAAPPSSPALEDEHLEAKMDAVLEKISREGKENLTESDKAILLKASEILRKKRS